MRNGSRCPRDYSGSHTITPGSNAITPGSHTITLGSHTITLGSHTINPDRHCNFSRQSNYYSRLSFTGQNGAESVPALKALVLALKAGRH